MDQPRVSVIIPVKNQERLLVQCLCALRESGMPDLEIIVADDGCTDGTAAAAEAHGSRVARVPRPGGVSAARNAGAAIAQGQILVFTDADIVFPPGALRALVDCASAPGAHGAVGVFSGDMPFGNFASIWKNHWMRYTYRRMPDLIALFFTSAAAVSADAFRESRGFDENYRAPSVEDTDLGRRLAARGCNIRLCREAEVIHHKRYSVADVLCVDYARACALVRLALRERANPKRQGAAFSVPLAYPLGAFALCAAAILAGAAIATRGTALLAAAAVLFVLALASSAGFLNSLRQEHGVAVFVKGELFWVADCVAVCLGAASGALGFLLGKRY